MAQNKFLALDVNGNPVEIIAIITSAGVIDANKLISTGADGRVDISFLPTGVGADTETAVCSEALPDGAFVNFYDNGGVRTCRLASSLDNTKPAEGFVLQAYNMGDNAMAYVRGLNSHVPLGSFVAADKGKPAFLGSAGAATKTAPASTGNLLQQLGPVMDVNTTSSLVTVNFSYNPGITRA